MEGRERGGDGPSCGGPGEVGLGGALDVRGWGS